MAKLYLISKKRKSSYKVKGGQGINGRRFFTSTDISIIKHDQAVHNSQIKRNEISIKGTYLIYPCGCGTEGCFLHIEK